MEKSEHFLLSLSSFQEDLMHIKMNGNNSESHENNVTHQLFLVWNKH